MTPSKEFKFNGLHELFASLVATALLISVMTDEKNKRLQRINSYPKGHKTRPSCIWSQSFYTIIFCGIRPVKHAYVKAWR